VIVFAPTGAGGRSTVRDPVGVGACAHVVSDSSARAAWMVVAPVAVHDPADGVPDGRALVVVALTVVVASLKIPAESVTRYRNV
jgi:hypothetical protein